MLNIKLKFFIIFIFNTLTKILIIIIKLKEICMRKFNKIQFFIFLLYIFIIIFSFCYKNIILEKEKNIKRNINDFKQKNNSKINNYYNLTFAIIKCERFSETGLFCLFKFYLYSLIKYLNNGFIPIIDLSSFPNIYNGFNNETCKTNPWELFFYQPFGYTLEEVKKHAKTIHYFECDFPKHLNHRDFYLNKFLIDFYHNIAIKYIPIKDNIIKEANMISKKLFKGSNNILGILQRGTDYISLKPRNHPIPPKNEIFFKDIKLMDKKYKYDYFFLSTEDDIIRDKFIKKFKNKIKIIRRNKNIKYNYKSLLAHNIYIKGNIDFAKNYLINIIILSNSKDIICTRTNGAIGAFILSNGFRNIKIYFLGEYN